MVKTQRLNKEQFCKVVERNYNQRRFTLEELEQYTERLAPEAAFALSRLLPKDIVARLSAHSTATIEGLGGAFSDKILDYHAKIRQKGPLEEVKEMQRTEEYFLEKCSSELLNLLGGVQ